MPEPTEIVHARMENIAGVVEDRFWEITYGNWNRVKGLSANGYWRDASEPVKDYETIEKTAKVRAVEGGVYYFDSRAAFIEFITFYCRGEIIEEISL